MKRKSLSEQDIEAARRLKDIWNTRKSELGLTQDRAAEIMGFSTQGAVSHYLNAKTPLNLEAVLKFSGLLKVPPESIRPDMADLLQIARQYMPEAENVHVHPVLADQRAADEDMKISGIEKELLRTFKAFPKEDQEVMLKEMRDKKETMDKTIERWLEARKGRSA